MTDVRQPLISFLYDAIAAPELWIARFHTIFFTIYISSSIGNFAGFSCFENMGIANLFHFTDARF